MTTPPTDELKMQAHAVETPASIEELVAYINDLATREHDYGSCVYAVSMAATATFNFMASKLGITGFQASGADLDVIRRTRNLKGPFILLDAEEMLYPQYDLRSQLDEAMQGWKSWAAEACAKKLAEVGSVHPDVKAHWEKLSQPQ